MIRPTKSDKKRFRIKSGTGSIRSGTVLLMAAVILSGGVVGCGNRENMNSEEQNRAVDDMAGNTIENKEAETETETGQKRGLVYETAADGYIDFTVLQQENPDIFAWLYVPGTEIDAPLLQSPVSDDYYKTHTADGLEGDAGALYTEMPNMMNMCDFNTIIHGNDKKKADLFADIHKFENPDFFTENEVFYIYLPDNVLTYEVFAAYYDEGSDILRRYDYTTFAGCQEHLQQIYGLRDMNKNLREGWEDLTPYHFLVTLKGNVREAEDRQYVVIGVLIGDESEKIDRVILD